MCVCTMLLSGSYDIWRFAFGSRLSVERYPNLVNNHQQPIVDGIHHQTYTTLYYIILYYITLHYILHNALHTTYNNHQPWKQHHHIDNYHSMHCAN